MMSDPYPLHLDQVEEYVNDGYRPPASVTEQQNEQFLQNEQIVHIAQIVQNEHFAQDDLFGQDDVPNESNHGAVPHAEEKNLLWPVLPGESGEGLPYAPIDWPYPGDIWTWRVGRRFNNSGYFQDRFLYLPKRLGKQSFASLNSVVSYLRSHFPDADVDAFFASFAWKIPVKIETTAKEEPASVNRENPPQDEKVTGQEEKKEESSSSRKRRISANAISATPLQAYQNGATLSFTPKRAKQVRAKASPTPKKLKKSGAKLSPAPKQTSQNGATISSTPRRKSRHSSKPSLPNDEGGAISMQDSVIEPIPEDFDNYLNSLEDILTQPVSENQGPSSSTDFYAAHEMADARRKLSSLLVMDFPSLVSSKHIFELATLASKLLKDPSLNAEQLVKLKLVEEISTFSEVFLESRELIEQVDEFFATLEARKAKVASLRNEYNELKEKTDQLQAQVDSSLMTVQEIDHQIALLQSRRGELNDAIDTNQAAKVEVEYAQKMVANSIPKVVQEIQLANAKTPDLEFKKTNALKREAEILAKFAPLQGFYL